MVQTLFKRIFKSEFLPMEEAGVLIDEAQKTRIKTRVIFIGSFLKESKSGGVGGQMFACRSLISSKLSDEIEWLEIDTTADTNLKRSVAKSLFKAFMRMSTLIWLLLTKRGVKKVLIFTSNSRSFNEKGLMALTASIIFSKKVIIAPRSGRMTNDLKNRRKRQFIHYVFSKCQHIVCQGEYWKNLYASEFTSIPINRFVVIKNWMNNDNINYSGIDKSGQKEGRILFLGWLVKDKGIFNLLEVAKKLRDTGTKFHMIIAGDGKEKEQLEKEIIADKLEDYVKVPGWVKGGDKLDLLKSCEIFVLPSYYEGMPNALMEAMAQGIPCVATKTGGIPDLINDKNNGLLSEVGNINHLYNNISELLYDRELREKIGRAALQTIIANHLVDNAIHKFDGLLAD